MIHHQIELDIVEMPCDKIRSFYADGIVAVSPGLTKHDFDFALAVGLGYHAVNIEASTKLDTKESLIQEFNALNWASKMLITPDIYSQSRTHSWSDHYEMLNDFEYPFWFLNRMSTVYTILYDQPFLMQDKDDRLIINPHFFSVIPN